MIKFKIYLTGNDNTITPVEIIRETAKSVYISKTRRDLKITAYCEYHDTFKEAYDAKLHWLKLRLKMYKVQVELSKTFLSRFKDECQD